MKIVSVRGLLTLKPWMKGNLSWSWISLWCCFVSLKAQVHGYSPDLILWRPAPRRRRDEEKKPEDRSYSRNRNSSLQRCVVVLSEIFSGITRLLFGTRSNMSNIKKEPQVPQKTPQSVLCVCGNKVPATSLTSDVIRRTNLNPWTCQTKHHSHFKQEPDVNQIWWFVVWMVFVLKIEKKSERLLQCLHE